MTEFLDRPDGRIAFDDTGGEGPLVIAVPGMGDVRGVYFLTPQLVGRRPPRGHHDLRGHGESSVGWPDHSAAAVGTDIVALVRALDTGPAAVLGESMAAAGLGDGR